MRVLGLYIKVSTNNLCWISVSLINQYICTVWRKASVGEQFIVLLSENTNKE